jgi:uncharacterized repeat protein (TIGR01451 family)
MVCRLSRVLNARRKGLTLIPAFVAIALLAAPALPAAAATRRSFTAGAPSARTSYVSITGATTATVTGAVNPAGQTTSYKAVYNLASSTWCTSKGTSGTPANSTAGQPLAYTDAALHSVSVSLTALTSGTSYCIAISATNPSATATGVPVRFTAGQTADLATTIQGDTIVVSGIHLYYTITVTNHGPDPASDVVMTDHEPYNTTFYSVSPSPGSSCTSPAVGVSGTVSCTIASLPPGASMTITLVVYLRFIFHNQLVVDSASATSLTFDPNTANNTATTVAKGA